MNDPAREYIDLAFALDAHLPGYVDGYFGPPAWRHKKKRPLVEIGQRVEALAGLVSLLPDERRRTFLGAQLRAMTTSVALLKGEKMSYRDEVRGLYDIEPRRVPERSFEDAIAAVGDLLPGTGDIAARAQALRARLELPADKLAELANLVAGELRRRTRKRFPLPAGEGFELKLVSNQPWSGYNWYLGGYRSRIDINTDLPKLVTRLPDLIAHEIYPGHHTEHALKEEHLYRAEKRLEHSILLINTPECVISEAIATRALEAVIAKDDLREWVTTDLAPRAGLAGTDAATLLEVASGFDALKHVSGNAALLLYEAGITDAEVLAYLERYGLKKPSEAKKTLEFLKHPTSRSYTYTYTVGYDLLGPLLAQDNRDWWFARLLTEAVTPGTVRNWVAGL